MSSPDRIAFIKTGAFSHTNESTLRLLHTQFPDFTIDVFDTGELPISRRYALPALAVLAIAHYGITACQSESTIRKYASRTPHYFRAVHAALARRLAGRRYRFTLQTQSMIDGSQPGIPHFVYTDHTHAANLYYPGVSRRDLYSDAWIEKERSIYAHARVIFTMNAHISRSLREHYGLEQSRIQCVRCGGNIAVPDAASLDGRRYSSKNILFVGIDWERKGGPQLLQAFRQVLARHPDATLTIVGCSLSIDVPNCRVVGRIGLDAVADHFRRAAIFCMPTRNEPVGMALIEACSYRLPVVTSRIGSLADLIRDGVTGFLTDPDDIDTLADRLCELLSDPARCRTMGNASFEHAQTHYSWERTGQLIGERIRRELADIFVPA